MKNKMMKYAAGVLLFVGLVTGQTVAPPWLDIQWMPSSGQLPGQVIGTCGNATAFAPCKLTISDLPITNLPQAGYVLTATSATTMAWMPAGGVVPPPPPPPSLDSMGGYTNVPCVNLNTAFSIVTIGRNKLFCDPFGHAFFSMGPFVFDLALGATADESGKTYQQYMSAKYPNGVTQWAAQEAGVLLSYGWNSLGTYANANALPTAGATVKLPFVMFEIVSPYSLINEAGWGTGPVDELGSLLSATWGGYKNPSNGIADYYNPNWVGMIAGSLKNDTTASRLVGAPAGTKNYLLGVTADDSDNLHGFGAAAQFATQPAGSNDYRWGYFTMFLAPTNYANSGTAQIFAGGSVPIRKRWVDLLIAKYKTVAALNTAWGSSYTTLGTSGTCVGACPASIESATGGTAAADVLGTGNGSTLAFSKTLAHTAVSRFSVGVFVAGVLVGGDTGNGAIWGPSMSGTVNYVTGAVAVTFGGGYAPASGAAVTVNSIANGWGIGSGLQDEDVRASHASYAGTGAWTVAVNLTGIPANVQTDIGAMTKDIAFQYSSNMKAQIQAWAKTAGFTGPVLYLGPTTLCTWTTPPDQYVLQGFAGNLDAMICGGNGTLTQAELDFINANIGDLPLIEADYRSANAQSVFSWPNSAATHNGATVTVTVAQPNKFSQLAGNFHVDATCNNSDYNVSNVNFSATATTVSYQVAGTPAEASAICNLFYDDSNGGFPSQQAKCLDYQTKVSALPQRMYTATGTLPYVGMWWWQWFDDQSQQLQWGLETSMGNPYNGADNATPTGPCMSPNGAFTCGGELALHGTPLGVCTTAVTATSAAIAATFNQLAVKKFK